MTANKPEQDLQHIDNPDLASTNFYWLYELGGQRFNLQTTIRATLTPGQIAAHFSSVVGALTICLGHGGVAKQVGKGDQQSANIETEATKAIANGEPVSGMAAMAAERGAQGLFDSEWIEVEIKSNKPYFKIGGGRYSRYGVRVWDEVLQEAGVDPARVLEASQESTEPHMKMQKHYRAYYSTNDKGSPDKIVLLEKLT